MMLEALFVLDDEDVAVGQLSPNLSFTLACPLAAVTQLVNNHQVFRCSCVKVAQNFEFVLNALHLIVDINQLPRILVKFMEAVA